MVNKLDALLSQEPVEEGGEAHIPLKRNPVAQAYITRSALNKANTYARLVCDVLEKSAECYGYLISPRGIKDRLVRDVYLAPNQVSSCDVKVSGEEVISAGRDIDKMGYKVLGWWHSHADFDPFHSGTDDENMMKVLNAIAATNFVTTYRPMPLMSGELGVRRRGTNVEIYEVNNPHKKFRLNLSSEEFKARDLGIVKSLVADMPARVGFAYSIVVNARGDKPYCEVATRDFCGLCYGGEERSVESRLRVINRDAFEIDEIQIARDIEKKIKKPEPIVSSRAGRVKRLMGRTRSDCPLTDLNNLTDLNASHQVENASHQVEEILRNGPAK